MTRNAGATVLIVVLMLNAAVTAVFSCAYVWSMRQLQQVHVEVEVVNRNRTLLQALANDAVEYGKRNPAMDPILQSIGIQPRPGSAPSQTKPVNR